MIFRMATYDDIPGLLPLFAQLGYPCTQTALEKRFEIFMSCEGYGVAVACLSEQIVGWVAWSMSKFFVLEKTRIRVEGIIVDSTYRGRGIGKNLVAFLENRAVQYGPSVIDLVLGTWRAQDGSHDFYKNLGYRNEGRMAKLYLRKEI